MSDEEAPELYVGTHRVTEADVLDALKNLGDEVLDNYKRGVMSQSEAFAIARDRLQQVRSMHSRSPVKDWEVSNPRAATPRYVARRRTPVKQRRT